MSAKITRPKIRPYDSAKVIFVFGSNLAGVHGAGSARHALDHYGAILGKGVGRQGMSYGIPTKDAAIMNTLPLEEIEKYVAEFLEYAAAHPDNDFLIVDIGCGLAGYTPDEIAPMFRGATDNCYFSEKFRDVLEALGKGNGV